MSAKWTEKDLERAQELLRRFRRVDALACAKIVCDLSIDPHWDADTQGVTLHVPSFWMTDPLMHEDGWKWPLSKRIQDSIREFRDELKAKLEEMGVDTE